MQWQNMLKNKNLLVIVLFFLFLASLFFISAILDVRRTKSLLLSMAESKGTAAVETLEAVVRERYDSLSLKSGSPLGPGTDLADIETQFRIKERAIERLIDSAKALDRRFKTRPPANGESKTLSNEFSVTGILFLDADNHILWSSLPLSGLKDLGFTNPAVKHNEVYIDVDLKGQDSQKTTHWVGISRENKPGRIFLMLDGHELDRLMLRVVYQEVLQETGRQKGVRYLLLVTPEGRVIAGSDRVEQGIVEKIIPKAIPLTNSVAIASSHIRWDKAVMDVCLPLKTGGTTSFFGIAGIDITQVQSIANRNMVHVFIFTGIILCSAGLVLVLIYRIQTRYNDRLQKVNEQLAQAQRLSSLGRLAAGVAHEIRNPLNAVSMAVQRIFREFKPQKAEDKKEFSRLTSIVRDEIDRLNRIIETFIEPARIKPGRLKPLSLTEFLSPIVSLAREAADPKGIEIDFNPPGKELIVVMDEPRLRQAVWNFLKNAVESIPGKGRISVIASGAENAQAQIRITDTGTGISSKALKRILEFEYTTKEKGLGLGLPIAREIVLAHEGRLEIDSTPGAGTTVRVLLPLHDTRQSKRKII